MPGEKTPIHRRQIAPGNLRDPTDVAADPQFGDMRQQIEQHQQPGNIGHANRRIGHPPRRLSDVTLAFAAARQRQHHQPVRDQRENREVVSIKAQRHQQRIQRQITAVIRRFQPLRQRHGGGDRQQPHQRIHARLLAVTHRHRHDRHQPSRGQRRPFVGQPTGKTHRQRHRHHAEHQAQRAGRHNAVAKQHHPAMQQQVIKRRVNIEGSMVQQSAHIIAAGQHAGGLVAPKIPIR